jgi:hypothetical protein
MKAISRIIPVILILSIALFTFPETVLAQAPNNDQIVFGGTYTLGPGQTLEGNLVILGGLATLENGSMVRGDVTLTGGSLSVNGEIKGSITAVGGSISLSDTAIVDGDISTIGAALNRSDKAEVKGSVSNSGPGSIRLPMSWSLQNLHNLSLGNILHPISNILWNTFQSLAIAALALLVALFLPIPTRRVAHTLVTQPVLAGGFGLLTVIVAPALVVVLAITIILIPLSLMGVLLLAIALVFGWIAIGLETGNRLAGLLHVNWIAPISAAVGTLVVSLVSGAVAWIPCVGWILPAVIAMVGLGGVLISRFGAHGGYPHEIAHVVPAPVAPPPVTPVPFNAPAAPAAPAVADASPQNGEASAPMDDPLPPAA